MNRFAPMIRLALLACVFVIACRKDPALADQAGYDPSPYLPALPSWVVDSIGALPQPADNPMTRQGVALGRRLFHEKALSDDYSMSCASCHLQANSFSDPLQFSVGTDGSTGTRNAMAIVDLAWSTAFFWDGRRGTLEDQAHDPVVNPIEMRATWPMVVQRLQADPYYPDLFAAAFGTTQIDSNLVVKAIAQFERSMVSFGSRFDRFYFGGDTSALTAEEKAGMQLFDDNDCEVCHPYGLFTDDAFRNNGLDLEPLDSGLALVTGLSTDVGKFKVPTLRNVAVTGPYMHDGRFPTLFDAVTFYGGHVQEASPNVDHGMQVLIDRPDPNFTFEEKDRLIAFLSTLTDTTFLADPAFGAP